MERYVERAIEAGLTELGFSDHLFMYWLPPRERDPELGMAEWEHDYYIEDVERCRGRYGNDIAIRLSTEADFIPGHERQLEAILSRYDWDYVIGSVHFLDGWGFDDSRYVAGYAEWDIDALYARYFSVVADSAATGFFDTIGHCDLVKKFGYRPTRPLDGEYKALAARFARAGVCVELNTAGLRKPIGEMYPHADLLAALHAAGVPITLGSDAHAPDEVASAFSDGAALLRQIGYTSFMRFEHRQRHAVQL